MLVEQWIQPIECLNFNFKGFNFIFSSLAPFLSPCRVELLQKRSLQRAVTGEKRSH
jgi:hypothetical protein